MITLNWFTKNFRSLYFLAAVSLTVAATAAPIKVACVGDSITFGAGIKDRQHDAYPVQLGRWLGPDYDVRNFGFSGATLLHKGDRPYFKQKVHAPALAFKADIVVIMLGANDSKHRGDGSLDSTNALNNWQYKADFVPDYEALVAEFHQANSNVTVYVCLPTPCFPGRWGINDKTIHTEIIPMVQQVAKDTNSKIIDMYGALQNHGNLFPDTIHPNADGARLMAAEVYRTLTGKEPPATGNAVPPQTKGGSARQTVAEPVRS